MVTLTICFKKFNKKRAIIFWETHTQTDKTDRDGHPDNFLEIEIQKIQFFFQNGIQFLGHTHTHTHTPKHPQTHPNRHTHTPNTDTPPHTQTHTQTDTRPHTHLGQGVGRVDEAEHEGELEGGVGVQVHVLQDQGGDEGDAAADALTRQCRWLKYKHSPSWAL